MKIPHDSDGTIRIDSDIEGGEQLCADIKFLETNFMHPRIPSAIHYMVGCKCITAKSLFWVHDRNASAFPMATLT